VGVMASLVIFSIDVDRLATFYASLLGARRIGERSGDVRLRTERDEVLVHSVPAAIAEKIEVSVPPEPREGAAIKPVFEVASLDVALERVRGGGGVVTNHSFIHEGVARHDVMDPDGNVVQLRCPVS
jgi:catechol 2,3-dioxygenase-like lactoylglutathione lyase family enzyme